MYDNNWQLFFRSIKSYNFGVNLYLIIFLFSVEEMDQYLHYIGGGAGALALTGVAAASAFYLASRPSSQQPLFPLDEQCKIAPVRTYFYFDLKSN